ncbi:MAG TPA: putative toxin-antitoxin system toxin component, PIN family [Bacteroidia bacterium]|nr:putative toxin-antitoxin system toxin component, PIN family [Bacteroidia bacterium]
MIACIDTNVFVQASKAGHPLHVIFTSWLQRKFLWALSNDILAEYEEILVQRSGRQRWFQFGRVLDLAEAQGGLLLKVQPSFQFHVIAADPDDNKFIDCAITAGADYAITEDSHFDPLANAGYKPKPIKPQEFIQRHLDGT